MSEDRQNISEEDREIYLKKTRWLYTGVFVFSAIIITFFTLALKADFQSHTWQKSSEEKIVTAAKDDIQKYLDQEKATLKQQAAEQAALEARVKLNEIVTNFEKNNKQGEIEMSASTTDTEAQISE